MAKQTPTNEAAEILLNAKNEVDELLKDEHSMLNVTIKSTLERLINRLGFVGGAASPIVEDFHTRFPPILNDPKDEPKIVMEQDTKPTQTAKEQLMEKANNLISNMHLLENDKILDEYRSKEDITVLRAAAKLSGLENFKSAEINGTFLDEIRVAILANAALAAENEAKNEDINQSK